MILSFKNYLVCLLTGLSFGCSNYSEIANPLAEAKKYVWAQTLYPGDEHAQKIIIAIVDIIKTHTVKDPFNGGRGPGFAGFGMHKVPIGFSVNASDTDTDLLIFNWLDKIVPTEFKYDSALSEAVGLRVYKIGRLKLRDLDSQMSGSYVSDFNFLPGSGNNFPVSLPKENFLRQALDKRLMLLITPQVKWLAQQSIFVDEAHLIRQLNTFVHEAYHIVEANMREAEGNFTRLEDENRNALRAAVRDPEFGKILAIYKQSILRLMDHISLPLKSEILKKPEVRLELARIRTVLKQLRDLNAPAFKEFIKQEYNEGFAEYVASLSLLENGHYTYKSMLDRHRNELNANAAFYQTGALGGMLMWGTVGNFDWQINKGHDELGIWEKLIEHFEPMWTEMPLPQVNLGVLKVGVDAKNMAFEMQKISLYMR